MKKRFFVVLAALAVTAAALFSGCVFQPKQEEVDALNDFVGRYCSFQYFEAHTDVTTELDTGDGTGVKINTFTYDFKCDRSGGSLRMIKILTKAVSPSSPTTYYIRDGRVLERTPVLETFLDERSNLSDTNYSRQYGFIDFEYQRAWLQKINLDGNGSHYELTMSLKGMKQILDNGWLWDTPYKMASGTVTYTLSDGRLSKFTTEFKATGYTEKSVTTFKSFEMPAFVYPDDF